MKKYHSLKAFRLIYRRYMDCTIFTERPYYDPP